MQYTILELAIPSNFKPVKTITISHFFKSLNLV